MNRFSKSAGADSHCFCISLFSHALSLSLAFYHCLTIFSERVSARFRRHSSEHICVDALLRIKTLHLLHQKNTKEKVPFFQCEKAEALANHTRTSIYLPPGIYYTPPGTVR